MSGMTAAGLENIKEAIVKQAVEDYFRILSGFLTENNEANISELQTFFKSDYFGQLCKYDAEYLTDKAEAKARCMRLKYDIAKQKGSNQYYIFEIGGTGSPIPGTFDKKKRCTAMAAKMNGMTAKEFNACRQRDKKIAKAKAKEMEQNDTIRTDTNNDA